MYLLPRPPSLLHHPHQGLIYHLFIIIFTFLELLMLGRKLNFLNIMFINIFFYESVVGCVMIPNFFSIGKKNLIGTDLYVWSYLTLGAWCPSLLLPLIK